MNRPFAALLVVVAACAQQPAATPSPPVSSDDAQIAAIAAVHGGAGPWVVAGYRMGEFALRTLDLPHGSFDLEVVHYSPHEVQYSCIADGAAVATGASMGKLNLTLVDAKAEETRTVYRRKSTGKSVELRATRAFATRYLDVPFPMLGAKGREVLHLRDEEIFEEVK
jgi:formylmethanofuran dehydrogenase subunit E